MNQCGCSECTRLCAHLPIQTPDGRSLWLSEHSSGRLSAGVSLLCSEETVFAFLPHSFCLSVCHSVCSPEYLSFECSFYLRHLLTGPLFRSSPAEREGSKNNKITEQNKFLLLGSITEQVSFTFFIFTLLCSLPCTPTHCNKFLSNPLTVFDSKRFLTNKTKRFTTDRIRSFQFSQFIQFLQCRGFLFFAGLESIVSILVSVVLRRLLTRQFL